MELSDVLTYISILIAILALSQEYFRLKLKLAPRILQRGFWFSLLLIYLCAFPVIRNFIFQSKILDTGFLLHKYRHGWGDFILISTHFIFLISIVYLGILRKGNQEQFNKLVLELISSKKYIELFRIVDKNLNRLLKLRYKPSIRNRILKRFDTKDFFVILYQEDSSLPKDDRGIPRIKEKIREIIGYLIFDIFKIQYKNNSYCERTLELLNEDKIINIMAEQDEILGFKIINALLDCEYKNKYGIIESNSDLKDFCEKLLIYILSNNDSILTSEIRKETTTSDEEVKQHYLKILLKHSDIIGLEGCVDKAISHILQQEDTKKSLNEPYYHGDYVRNTKIVHQIRDLLDLFEKINIEKLIMSNTFRFLLRDFIEITDFTSDNRNQATERNSGTSYLVYYLFDVCEHINEKSNFKYLSIYYLMLENVLKDEDAPDFFKEQTVNSFFNFLVRGTEEEIKLKFYGTTENGFDRDNLKSILQETPTLSKYFKISVYDRTTHQFHKEGVHKEISKFIDSLNQPIN